MIKTSKTKRTRKYFAPQNEGVEHLCDHPGCHKKGEFKAPKDKTLKSYYWFCLEHVQEYNAQWNYYIDESTETEQETFRQRTRFRGFHSKIKYKFGCDLEEELDFLHGFSGYDKVTDSIYFTKSDKKELQYLELNSEDVSIAKLKKQYKKLAKAYHPDLHPEDKEAEEKFKRLTAAYKKLLEKMS
ncbi:MAG: DnaJ domain-containing protein [Alphaproteobacteria bacterium]|nr:DnaJ domain-containing protein [Alphaproteobacteria bacterium]